MDIALLLVSVASLCIAVFAVSKYSDLKREILHAKHQLETERNILNESIKGLSETHNALQANARRMSDDIADIQLKIQAILNTAGIKR